MTRDPGASAVETVTSNRPLSCADWARHVGELPSLPSAFLAALDALAHDHAPAAACIEAIERDQALTVRILRLANSAFYGAPGQIACVGDAVQMLGLRTVASALAAMSLRNTLGSLRCEGFCFTAYWRHSLCTAISARELAKIALLDAGEAFLTGLLHDVGKLVLAMTNPALEAQALQLCQAEDLTMHEAERRALGVSHAEVGAAVTRQWHFPASISNAIAAHHRPWRARPMAQLTAPHLVRAANHLAHALEAPPEARAQHLAEPCWLAMGLNEKALHALATRIDAELQPLSCA